MEAFARARQFRDVEALRALHSKLNLEAIEDSVRVQHARYRAISPSTPLVSTDPTFRRFVLQDVAASLDSSSQDRFAEMTATAFAVLEGSDPSRAALVILAYYYEFPPASVVISNSAYSFARADGSKATYYLSEDWELPLSNIRIPKRFVVEWIKSRDGAWLLGNVR
jgi:hypothetical protein